MKKPDARMCEKNAPEQTKQLGRDLIVSQHIESFSRKGDFSAAEEHDRAMALHRLWPWVLGTHREVLETAAGSFLAGITSSMWISTRMISFSVSLGRSSPDLAWTRKTSQKANNPRE